MRIAHSTALVVAGLALLLAGCDDRPETSPTPPAPTEAAPTGPLPLPTTATCETTVSPLLCRGR